MIIIATRKCAPRAALDAAQLIGQVGATQQEWKEHSGKCEMVGNSSWKQSGHSRDNHLKRCTCGVHLTSAPAPLLGFTLFECPFFLCLLNRHEQPHVVCVLTSSASTMRQAGISGPASADLCAQGATTGEVVLVATKSKQLVSLAGVDEADYHYYFHDMRSRKWLWAFAPLM